MTEYQAIAPPGDNFDDVGQFHRKFGLPVAGERAVGNLDASTFDFRMKFMEEELREFEEGWEETDLAKMADSLVDLVYVVLGTAHYMGLPWQELWDEVQRANMTKERAAKDGSNSKRGTGLDVVKPEGWTPPDIAGILLKHMDGGQQ